MVTQGSYPLLNSEMLQMYLCQITEKVFMISFRFSFLFPANSLDMILSMSVYEKRKTCEKYVLFEKWIVLFKLSFKRIHIVPRVDTLIPILSSM